MKLKLVDRFGSRISKLIMICICYLIIPSAQAADKVTVILDWFLNASHASLLAAEYSGAFKRHDLIVELIAPADPSTPTRLVAAGQGDLTFSYPLQLGMMVDQNVPLVQVGFLLDKSVETLVTKKSITSISQLKGKTIGVSVTGGESLILSAMLEKNGLKLSDVHRILVNFQLEQALMSGSVDAIIGVNRNYELIDFQLKHYPINYFFPADQGVPIYDAAIIVARKSTAQLPKIVRFMQALKEGNEYLQKHPDEILQQVIKDHPELNTPLNKAAWMATLPLIATDPAKIEKNKMQDLLKYMLSKGAIKYIHPIDDYIYDLNNNKK